jgi:hypothetical protein
MSSEEGGDGVGANVLSIIKAVHGVGDNGILGVGLGLEPDQLIRHLKKGLGKVEVGGWSGVESDGGLDGSLGGSPSNGGSGMGGGLKPCLKASKYGSPYHRRVDSPGGDVKCVKIQPKRASHRRHVKKLPVPRVDGVQSTSICEFYESEIDDWDPKRACSVGNVSVANVSVGELAPVLVE